MLLLAAVAAGALAGCGEPRDTGTRLALANASIERGEYATASIELSNVVQAAPANAGARVLLARVSLAAGRADVAQAQLEAARNLGSDVDVTLPLMGRALLAQGKFDELLALGQRASSDPLTATIGATLTGTAQLYRGEAEAAQISFRNALALAPDSNVARVGLARTLMASGATDDAVTILERVIRADPFFVSAHQAMGALRFSQQRFADAERAFSDAIDIATGLDQADELMLANVGLVECQWRMGKRSKALLNVKDLLDQYPWHPLPRYVRALLAFDDGDYKLAAEYLDEVQRILPSHEPSLRLRAATSFAQGKLGQAELYLDEYFDDNDHAEPEMLRLLADTYLRMGNGQQAVATLVPIIHRDADAGLLELYGTANLYAGNPAAGIEALVLAMQKNPQRLELRMRLAAALLNVGAIEAADRVMATWPASLSTEQARTMLRLLRFLREPQTERAVEYAKRRRRDDPSDLHALLALAEVAHDAGDREQSLRWLQVARERNPDAIEPRILLANYAQRQGEYADLLALAQEILSVQPHNATGLRLLGEAQLASGDNGLALATFREAIRVAPDLPANALNLARAQLANSDFWSAQETLFAQIERTPRGVAAAISRIVVEEHRRGHKEQARSLAQALQTRFEDNAIGFRVAGDLAMIQADYAEALTGYQAALAREPDRETALKCFAAAQAAGSPEAARILRDWLAVAPNDRQLQRVLEATGAAG